MERARETLVEADLMALSGHWNGCVNRLYYACFSAATAFLLKQDHYCSVKAHDSAAWHGETSLSRY
jgi:uncharacterized protein (UPF0332 family)